MDDEDITLIMTEQEKNQSYGRRVCDFEVTDPLFRSANESTPEVSLWGKQTTLDVSPCVILVMDADL